MLAGISSASIQGRIALGPRAGARVWRIGEEPDAPWVLSSGFAGAAVVRGSRRERQGATPPPHEKPSTAAMAMGSAHQAPSPLTSAASSGVKAVPVPSKACSAVSADPKPSPRAVMASNSAA